jgi:hypothetical protein
MSTIFLSYSRADLPLIERLEAELKSYPEVSIWRDQEKIYDGQKLPKVLGKAIGDQDVFYSSAPRTHWSPCRAKESPKPIAPLL